MRSLRTVAAMLAFMLVAVACGTDADETQNDQPDVDEAEVDENEVDDAEAEEADGDDLAPVALIVAQGGLGDESYNDLAYAGFQEGLAETGVQGTEIESEDVVAQGEQILRRAGEDGFGLVLGLEFAHAEIMGPIAEDFPDTYWAIYNNVIETDNGISVLFEEQEGSYLAGALAARMTSVEGNDKINSDAKIIGVVGGTESVGIDKFIVGFVQGAMDTDPEVEVIVNYADDFGDPARGQAMAEAMFERGADIVYHVAGGTGAGVIQAAEESNRYAIGVDTDQDNLAPGYVLTSMVKRVDVATLDLIERYASGELEGGETVNYGLAEDGVGLSEFEFTRDDIPDDILAEIEELQQAIVSGEIDVWNVIEDGYPDFFG